jgi:eukaryotic translation initiation factor 2C
VENKPSFTSMVANIDPTFSRYVAISKVQKSRQEIIDDSEEMVKVLFWLFFTFLSSF